MATHNVKNISTGIRGFHSTEGLVEIAPGQTAEGVEISDAELRSAKRTGWFEIESGGGGHGDPDKPKREAGTEQADDLDTTVPKLREIAAAEEIDLSGMTTKADIQGAIRAARITKAGVGTGSTGGEADALDGMDDATLRSTVQAITGKSEADVADLDRAALLALARGEG